MYISRVDREIKTNCKVLRDKILEFVVQKKEKLKNDPSGYKNGDLLTILISDDLFKDNEEMIIDEVITFFFAGSATTSALMANTIAYAMQNE